LEQFSLISAIGLVVVFLTATLMQQRIVEKWRQDTGRAPLLDKSKRSQHEYMRLALHEMPASMRKQIVVLNWIMQLAVMLFFALVAVNSWRHRH